LTLAQYIAAGYRHAMGAGMNTDPAKACATAISRASLTEAAQALDVANIQSKDHVSRVQLQFIQRVLAMQT
jgi:hypothetical protein